MTPDSISSDHSFRKNEIDKRPDECPPASEVADHRLCMDELTHGVKANHPQEGWRQPSIAVSHQR